jgi:glycosyltransferase involved in cell wall biosynthesis
MADLRTPDPRKRVEWLDGIAARLAARGIPLVLAGPGTERRGGLGKLADAQLAELLGRARALAYTSAYEGQGLPPLEAIELGTPVIAMRNTSLPEVIGDAGILLAETRPPGEAARGPHRAGDPEVARLADACLEVATDDALHGQLVVACARRPRFTAARFADGIRAAYELGCA